MHYKKLNNLLDSRPGLKLVCFGNGDYPGASAGALWQHDNGIHEGINATLFLYGLTC